MLVLASSSKRRQEILAAAGYHFLICKPDIAEILNDQLSLGEKIIDIARKKAEVVRKIYPNADIIAADTVVCIEDTILGKPVNKKEAVQMLQSLSGKEHFVITGVSIIKKGKIIEFFDETKVYFKNITEEEIINYVNTGEPMDKAGAYAIQGLGRKYVEKFIGSYNNVVGLPIEKINKILK